MSEDIKILVQYTKTTETQTFSDAIVLSKDEYDAMTPEQLNAIKQDRFDKWLAVQEEMAALVAAQEIPAEA